MSGSPSQSSVAGELSQLEVTWVELPELRTQLNSGGTSCNAERSQVRLKSVSQQQQQQQQLRLLPHLVRHYYIWFGATLNQTTECRRCLMESFTFMIQHHDRINTVFPHSSQSSGCLTCSTFGFEECLTR